MQEDFPPYSSTGCKVVMSRRYTSGIELGMRRSKMFSSLMSSTCNTVDIIQWNK